ncbi:unnamed protein product [Diabrotica balteata]|uniref:Uncharacterized protein n=1 Tax=Diabrotica balteata TaxID=107213 RepID=A0A9N9SLJ5_DIABA|nr:unnamed protein product [Diabrotica balteata]
MEVYENLETTTNMNQKIKNGGPRICKRTTGCWTRVEPATGMLEPLGASQELRLDNVIYQEGGEYRCVGPTKEATRRLDFLRNAMSVQVLVTGPDEIPVDIIRLIEEQQIGILVDLWSLSYNTAQQQEEPQMSQTTTRAPLAEGAALEHQPALTQAGRPRQRLDAKIMLYQLLKNVNWLT